MDEAQTVSTRQLGIYLNDHLAGSVAALELIEHLAKKFHGSHLEGFLADLHAEITADQDVVRSLIQTFEGNESAVRKAGAWIAEKLSHVKFGLGEHDVNGTGLLQALEALVIGITGKQLLWRALSSAAQRFPQLRGLDYAQLEERALAQRERVEEKRLAAARDAFRETE